MEKRGGEKEREREGKDRGIKKAWVIKHTHTHTHTHIHTHTQHTNKKTHTPTHTHTHTHTHKPLTAHTTTHTHPHTHAHTDTQTHQTTNQDVMNYEAPLSFTPCSTLMACVFCNSCIPALHPLDLWFPPHNKAMLSGHI